MFKTIAFSFLWFGCLGAMEQDAQKLETFIINGNLKGVQKMLLKNPDLVNTKTYLPGSGIQLQVAFCCMLGSLDSSYETYKSITKELLDSKNIDINQLSGKRNESVLICSFNPDIPKNSNLTTDEMNEWFRYKYKILIARQDCWGYFLAMPQLDITLKSNDQGCMKSALDYMDEYGKFDQTYYENLLKLFLDLNIVNEKSWNEVFDRMLGLDDIRVVEQAIYQKLKDQAWFKNNFLYPVFNTLSCLIPEGAISQEVAHALRTKWAGKEVDDKNFSDYQKNSVAQINQVYAYAKKHELKKLGRKLTDYIKVADIVRHEELTNIGSMIARY